MRIVLVDDSWTDRFLLKESLRRHLTGVEFEEFETGEQLFQFIEGLGQGSSAREAVTSLDLIILDLHLPRTNGRELIARIRANAVLCEVPVVVWSGLDATVGKRSIAGFEACHYVGKPKTADDCLNVGKVFSSLVTSAMRSQLAETELCSHRSG